MRPKELQEDIEWLEELYTIRTKVGSTHPHYAELEEEIKKTRDRMATHDYGEREARRVAHFKEKGQHDCWIY